MPRLCDAAIARRAGHRSADRGAAWREGMSAAERAIEIDRSLAFAHSLKGLLLVFAVDRDHMTRRFAVNYVGLGELAKARAPADRVTFAARTAQAKARRPSRRQGPGLRPRT